MLAAAAAGLLAVVGVGRSLHAGRLQARRRTNAGTQLPRTRSTIMAMLVLGNARRIRRRRLTDGIVERSAEQCDGEAPARNRSIELRHRRSTQKKRNWRRRRLSLRNEERQPPSRGAEPTAPRPSAATATKGRMARPQAKSLLPPDAGVSPATLSQFNSTVDDARSAWRGT